MDQATPRYRTVFVSDVHLGTRGSQAQAFLSFLRDTDADHIYLVGDIVDGWQLKKAWHWPQSHNDVVQKLLRKVRKGTRLTYIPGNHDEFLRHFLGTHFGGIEVVDEAVHVTADGRRYLVLHGDVYDGIIRHAENLARIGDWAYDAAVFVDRRINMMRRRMGLPYWSLSSWAKSQVKQAVDFIGKFEAAACQDARRRGFDGIICGHIHHPAIETRDGLAYVNCGDWVESLTAVGETPDGRLELIRWQPARAPRLDAADEAVPVPRAA